MAEDRKEGLFNPMWEDLKNMGNQAFKSNDYNSAIELYGKAIDINPAEAVLYSNRSAAYLKRGDFKMAAKDARKAVELNSLFIKAYTRLHAALCNMGELAEAAEVMKDGVAKLSSSSNPTFADLKTLRELQRTAEESAKAVNTASQFLREGRHSDAARLLTEPYRSFPDCSAIAFLYAEARAAQSPVEVNKLLSSFAHAHEGDPRYLYLRSLALYYQGQDGLKRAQAILRQALEYDPDNSNAGVLLKKVRSVEAKKESGNTAFKQKNYKEALECYTAAMEIDPSNACMNATIRGNRAAANMELKNYKAAFQDCDFAINNGVRTPKMYARRSRVLEQLDKIEDALRDMQQAVEGDSSYEGELRQLKARAKRAKRKDYYKTLGLSQNEQDANVIKRAYKKACLQWHPDKWAHVSEEEKNHAETQFKEVGEAFAVLSDPKKKRLYDSGQLDNDVEGANGPQSSGQNEEFMEMMNMMFASGGGVHGGFPSSGARRHPRGGGTHVFFNTFM